MEHLIFFVLFSLFILLVMPYFISFNIKFNILKLKGKVIFRILKIFKIELNIRIKNGYVYINRKNKIQKEKISNKNIKLRFLLRFMNELYFREQLLKLNFYSNFGYINDSCVTAVGSGYIDVIAKSIIAKIKNNKKYLNILIDVKPKYNEDILNMRLNYDINISPLEMLMSLLYAAYYTWRDNEKNGNNKLNKRQED